MPKETRYHYGTESQSVFNADSSSSVFSFYSGKTKSDGESNFRIRMGSVFLPILAECYGEKSLCLKKRCLDLRWYFIKFRDFLFGNGDLGVYATYLRMLMY